jgi:hypothetical protein
MGSPSSPTSPSETPSNRAAPASVRLICRSRLVLLHREAAATHISLFCSVRGLFEGRSAGAPRLLLRFRAV